MFLCNRCNRCLCCTRPMRAAACWSGVRNLVADGSPCFGHALLCQVVVQWHSSLLQRPGLQYVYVNNDFFSAVSAFHLYSELGVSEVKVRNTPPDLGFPSSELGQPCSSLSDSNMAAPCINSSEIFSNLPLLVLFVSHYTQSCPTSICGCGTLFVCTKNNIVISCYQLVLLTMANWAEQSDL